MTATLLLLGGLVALVLIVTGIGYSLPVSHTASRERTYETSIDQLFAVVANSADYPRWRRGVKSVEQLQARDGKASFREDGSNGPMTFVLDEVVPGRRIVSRIGDAGLAFGGKWTYEFTSTGDGARLRITEDGEVYNPFFRFMARYVFGHERTMTEYLADLDEHLVATRRTSGR